MVLGNRPIVTVKQLHLAESRLQVLGKPDLNFRDWTIRGAADSRFGVIQESICPGGWHGEEQRDAS